MRWSMFSFIVVPNSEKGCASSLSYATFSKLRIANILA
jgi:hypothetical protein